MAVNINHRIKLFLTAILLIAATLLTGCNDTIPALVKGKPTPEISLQNLQGQTVNFPQQFENKLVLISFWADWCPSCYREMQDFEVIFQQYKQHEFNILAINIEQDRETAKAFIKDLDLSYQILFDTHGEIAKAYSVSALPAAFIISKDGTLHTRILGETPATIFDQIVRALL